MSKKKKYNFTFFQDLLREKRGGKYSSKKIWGMVIMLLVCIAFILDGLNFYKVNENLFNAMLLAGTTLVGLTSALSIFGKKEATQDLSNEEQN